MLSINSDEWVEPVSSSGFKTTATFLPSKVPFTRALVSPHKMIRSPSFMSATPGP